MPILRPTEVARYDARFFVDVVMPALSAAGFDAPVALVLREPDQRVGDADDAAIVIECTGAELEALLAGKQPTALQGDRARSVKSATKPSTLVVRATAGALRDLVLSQRPRSATRKGASRELGAEASAPALRKKRDRVRTAAGHYIKGVKEGAPAPRPKSAVATTLVMGEQKVGPSDRVGFALQNLVGFIDAALSRVPDVGPDELLTLLPGEVHRG